MKIAHAGHAELLVNNLEASKKFFTETMGLFITEEDAPYRLSVKRLGACAAGMRSPFQASHPSALGARPPRSWSQHLYLSPRPGQADRRTVHRVGYHARRRPGLL